ncbi:ABC-2 family transporter protein [Mobilitalea sibirica]|uniref:ABC-2 family transporter protein n=1 Tax=Mobilitalea sibirica TaxID=1462919 RepID=A0A8J7H2G7_9FIRM|nr:ABC-2 family transporter protein [Mobilitalea sibirica]MBH1940979.1 ABC-2 family transporter protein [Mobilitalea sibirica]
MRKDIEIIKLIFKTQLVWRFDIAANVLFTISKIVFAYIVWSAVFGEKEMIAGFTFHTMLSYYIISSFLSQLDMSERIGWDISSAIRGGTFSKFMVLPINTERYFIARTIGASAFHLLFHLIAAVIWIFIFQIRFAFTGDIYMLLSAACFVIIGLLFMMQLNYMLGILTFQFGNIDVFLMIKSTLVSFITGTLVPLILLPASIVAFMRVFPFYYITYLPSMLLIGQNRDEIITGIITLSLWVLAFVPVNKLLYHRLRVRFDGVGI